jgi:5-methylcytosine-specific restriction enzyme subunit McrC
MRTETVTESQPSVLALTPAEASGLAAVGARLASQKEWWGAADAEADPAEGRTIIRVQPVGHEQWSVRVSDAVGVIAVGELELLVAPKIPQNHLLHLLARGGELPRLDEAPVHAAVSPSLWELVARAFVEAAEHLLRLGLIRDYRELADTLDAASGRIEVLGTTSHYYGGRLALDCVFDDFSFDTPLNRVVLAAVREIAESPILPDTLRLRAVRLLAWLDDVGDLQPLDVTIEVDRRTHHYDAPLRLARHILRHVGRHLTAGSDAAWSFLLRTPEMIERGVMGLLADRLGPARVWKGHRQLPGSTLTFNPDLVFDGGQAIGDVKYKLSKGDWDRADLYEVIAFAEAYRASQGLILRFREPGVPAIADLAVGAKKVHEVTWAADPSVDPIDAANAVADEVARWLGDGVQVLSA